MLSEKRKEDDAKFFAALKKKEEERRIAAEQASKNTQSEILYERRPLRRMSPPLMFAALAIGLGSLGGNFGAPRNVITPKKR